ncbi:MAG TPA: indole-3-glycerol phosphate synthase TrpC [Candidatus Eisenbacteria bacterium]
MILEQIVRRKKDEISCLMASDPARLPRADRDFGQALGRGRSEVRLIAEVKRASPSAGLLTSDFDPVEIAHAYQGGGAAAVSVLTDRDFFGGSIDDLRRVSEGVSLPVLRKDFVIDERQIHEARDAGAHAILLIAAILDRKTMQRFLAESRALGMEPLVEIHDERERDVALEAGASIVGINNRNLDDFRIDTGTTFRLAAGLPHGLTIVSESGVESESGVAALVGHADAVLVGTALMRSADRKGFAAALVKAGRNRADEQ